MDDVLDELLGWHGRRNLFSCRSGNFITCCPSGAGAAGTSAIDLSGNEAGCTGEHFPEPEAMEQVGHELGETN